MQFVEPAIALGSILVTWIWMIRIRSSVSVNGQDLSDLKLAESVYILVLSVLAPVIAPAIFYYGWKARLPNKARRANKLGWISFAIALVGFVLLGV